MEEYDSPMELHTWNHPANKVIIKNIEDANTEIYFDIYTDGSKMDDNVGAGAAILTDGNCIKTLKYKLNHNCSNNQAEQIAILHALKEIQQLSVPDHQKSVAAYTDSQVTLALLINNKKNTTP